MPVGGRLVRTPAVRRTPYVPIIYPRALMSIYAWICGKRVYGDKQSSYTLSPSSMYILISNNSYVGAPILPHGFIRMLILYSRVIGDFKFGFHWILHYIAPRYNGFCRFGVLVESPKDANLFLSKIFYHPHKVYTRGGMY